VLRTTVPNALSLSFSLPPSMDAIQKASYLQAKSNVREPRE
jgi:hypothetical protein